MKVLARHAAGKALQNDNLEIANRAKEAKKIDSAVINATSGMFFTKAMSSAASGRSKKF